MLHCLSQQVRVAGLLVTAPLCVLLLIGDSSAVGVGVASQTDALLGQLIDRLAGHMTVHYELVAQTGAKTIDVLGWLDTMPPARFDVAVTALGVNDVTKGVSLRKWLSQQTNLFDRLIRQFWRAPRHRVGLAACWPVPTFAASIALGIGTAGRPI